MNVTALDNTELKTMMTADPDLLLLDVRTPEEFYGLGHIPEARLLPIWEIPEAVGSLEKERKTVLICEHGVRSADAAAYLARCGFSRIYNLTAGMAEWDGSRIFN